MSKYLFIGAHVDDESLCCGGTIVKLKEQGHEIIIVTLSHIYGGIDLSHEWHKAQILLQADHSHLLNFETRMFYRDANEILQTLFKLNEQYKPDYTYTHSSNDIHADHRTVGYQSQRVFKKQNLITFAGEWNMLESESNFYHALTDEHLSKKMDILACYESQQTRSYFDRQFTYSKALLSGAKIGAKYAEAFRILNMIG